MIISLINGSPKAKDSCSQYLLSEIKNLLDEDNEIYEFNTRAGILPTKSLETLRNSDALVIAFPLYFDSLPSHLLKFLEALEIYFNNKDLSKIKVYAISNCGFYEGEQNKISLKIIENWCHKCGMIFAGGLGIGAGPVVKEFLNIKLGSGLKKNLGIALNNFCTNILNDSVYSNVYTTINYPKRLYILQGNLSWTSQAKKNGLKKQDIYSLE